MNEHISQYEHRLSEAVNTLLGLHVALLKRDSEDLFLQAVHARYAVAALRHELRCAPELELRLPAFMELCERGHEILDEPLHVMAMSNTILVLALQNLRRVLDGAELVPC